MDHLERFEDLISAIRVKGVSENYLFRYYLAGEALHWLKQLQPGSLKSWSDIKNAYLCNFFGEAHVEDLRSKIYIFTQEAAESFRVFWIRFKSYKMALDASSNGNFNTMNPEEAVKVIENLASSNKTKNTDFERKKTATILGMIRWMR